VKVRWSYNSISSICSTTFFRSALASLLVRRILFLLLELLELLLQLQVPLDQLLTGSKLSRVSTSLASEEQVATFFEGVFNPIRLRVLAKPLKHSEVLLVTGPGEWIVTSVATIHDALELEGLVLLLAEEDRIHSFSAPGHHG
jgi:hypothetical protein